MLKWHFIVLSYSSQYFLQTIIFQIPYFKTLNIKKFKTHRRHHELKKDIQDTNHPICACDTKIDKTPQFFCVFTTSNVSDTGC